MRIQLTKEFTANNIGDVLYLTVKEGPLCQKALVEEISNELVKLGFSMSGNDSHFSELINNQSSNLYKYLHVVLSIAKNQQSTWLAEYFAAACGGTFIKNQEEVK